MKILIIGGGGREHALAWKAAQSTKVTTVYVAPGNAGTALEPKCENVPISAEDIAGLLNFAKETAIDLTIVGPEAPLVAGVVDTFQQADLLCFGPSAKAAQLEGSKTFSKDFLKKYAIPTATYQSFTNLDAALSYLDRQSFPIVIKADGLAAGKGVVIAENLAQAQQTVTDMLAHNQFGAASSQVVIEDFLVGEEVSFIVMVDGKHILPLATSQDHKARYDGDTGPNTGGMGAYSPAPRVTPELHQRIMKTVIEPTIAGLAQEGIAYTGFLYAGLMVSADNTPNVLEFNCRFGDPETQPIMMRLESDLVELCLAACQGKLDSLDASWRPESALGVVMVAAGYPDTYRKGDIITGLSNQDANSKIFHAGTSRQGDQTVTNGGRVLCVTALAPTLQAAQNQAYTDLKQVEFDGASYRTDIGHRAL